MRLGNDPLAYVEKRLNDALCLEDLFGEDPDPSALNESYLSLSIMLDEGSKKIAKDKRGKLEACRASLSRFRAKAEEAIANGSYGERAPLFAPVPIKVGDAVYVLERLIETTETLKVYRGSFEGKPIIVRRAVGADEEALKENSKLLINEASALGALLKDPEEPNRFHLPSLIASFAAGKGQINITEPIEGYSFYEIRSSPHQKKGVSGHHLGWIMERSLTVLSFCHSIGFIHARLTPDRLIVTPRNHNVTISDWRWALSPGQSAKMADPVYGAPELKEGLQASPSSDIYSLGKCIIRLSGGNPKNNTVPVSLPEGLANLLKWMVMPSPLQRPRDAYALNQDLKKLRLELYGPSEFVDLPI